MNHYHVWSLLIKVPQQRLSYDGPVGLKPSGQLPQECPPPGLNAEWSSRAGCEMDWNVACTEGVGGDSSHHVFHNVCTTKPSPDCTAIERKFVLLWCIQPHSGKFLFGVCTLVSVFSVCVHTCAVPFQLGTTLWFCTWYSGSSGPTQALSIGTQSWDVFIFWRLIWK